MAKQLCAWLVPVPGMGLLPSNRLMGLHFQYSYKNEVPHCDFGGKKILVSSNLQARHVKCTPQDCINDNSSVFGQFEKSLNCLIVFLKTFKSNSRKLSWQKFHE